jgi:transcriptional regulator with XRE-family HTH domain
MQKGHKMHFEKIIHTIKERREVLQVNQENLAKLSGVGLRTLKQFERGKGNPTLLTVTKLADVLGLEVELNVKQLRPNETSEGAL